MEFAPYVFEERGRSFGELIAFLQMTGYSARQIRGGILNLSPSLEKTIPHGGSINVILDP